MKILDSLVEMVRVVHELAGKVARHDRDLAQQMKRASTSVALNGARACGPRQGSDAVGSRMRSTRRGRL